MSLAHLVVEAEIIIGRSNSHHRIESGNNILQKIRPSSTLNPYYIPKASDFAKANHYRMAGEVH